MKLTRKQYISNINDSFDKAHYIEKRKRSLVSLLKSLLYLSAEYKDQIRQFQKEYSHLNQRKIKIKNKELVACSIGAKSKKFGVFGTSHKLLSKSDYHKLILEVLQPLGSIGNLSNIQQKNAIGKCAEVKAANSILKLDKKAKISDIEFTSAIRPRTLEKMKRCNNCIAVFGDE